MAIVLCQIHMQAVEYILDDHGAAASRKGLWLVNSIILASVLRHTHAGSSVHI